MVTACTLRVSTSLSRSYDPAKSGASNDKVAAFVSADVEESLDQVPGIGPVAKGKLRENGVETTYQLLGKFLTFKSEVSHCATDIALFVVSGASVGAVLGRAPCRVTVHVRGCASCVWMCVCGGQGISAKGLCDAMYGWLGEIGISAHRSTIVKAVAEKVRRRAVLAGRRSSFRAGIAILRRL